MHPNKIRERLTKGDREIETDTQRRDRWNQSHRTRERQERVKMTIETVPEGKTEQRGDREPEDKEQKNSAGLLWWGSVVKNLPANAGDSGLIPDLGRSHMLSSN